jgi:hypothetical protein
MKRLFLLVFALVMVCGLYSCSGGGNANNDNDDDDNVAPTITKIVDGNGTELSDGSEDVNPNCFLVEFDQEMDATTVTDESLSVSCEGFVPVFTVAHSKPNETDCPDATAGADDSFWITEEEAWRHQLASCTISLADTITNADGVALAADGTCQITSGCAISDDFSTDSQECWAYTSSNEDLPDLSDAITADILAFDSEDGQLDYNSRRLDAAYIVLSKTVDIDSAGFDVVLKFSAWDITGMNTGVMALISGNGNKAINFGVANSPGADPTCYVSYGAPGLDREAAAQRECTTGETYFLYVRIVCDEHGLQTAVSGDGILYDTMDADEGDFSTITPDDFTEDAAVGLIFLNLDGATVTSSIEEVSFTGVTSDTQYWVLVIGPNLYCPAAAFVPKMASKISSNGIPFAPSLGAKITGSYSLTFAITPAAMSSHRALSTPRISRWAKISSLKSPVSACM